MEAKYKLRKCLSCEALCEKPGDVTCPRCRIEYSDPPKKYKILLIDDDFDLLKELKKKLEAMRYFEVETAYDGLKGFTKLAYAKPELILLDVNMPRMNGPAFVEKLRKEDADDLRDLPIIVLGEKEQMKKHFSEGDIQGFFLKPVHLKELFKALKVVLKIDQEAKES